MADFELISPKKGKRLISASEVATYVVCPEMWRLQRKFGSSYLSKSTKKQVSGREAHDEWAKKVNESSNLLIGVRVILYLLAGSIIILAIMLTN